MQTPDNRDGGDHRADKAGLNLVKKGRIEEARRIKYIEEHIELTKKGLEQIKTGRMEEATHYSQQLEAIEEKIELTRNSLQQVKEGEAEMSRSVTREPSHHREY